MTDDADFPKCARCGCEAIPLLNGKHLCRDWRCWEVQPVRARLLAADASMDDVIRSELDALLADLLRVLTSHYDVLIQAMTVDADNRGLDMPTLLSLVHTVTGTTMQALWTMLKASVPPGSDLNALRVWMLNRTATAVEQLVRNETIAEPGGTASPATRPN